MSKKAPNKRIQKKREYCRIRSNLKTRIRHGAILPKHILRKYHLDDVTKYRRESRIPKETEKINIPKVFCLIKNHNATIKFLNELDRIFLWKEPKNLHFNHKKTKDIGLAASFLFNQKIKKYKKKWSEKWYLIEFSGVISETKEVNNFLLSFGLLKTLNIYKRFNSNLVDYDYQSKYVTFKYSGSNKYNYMKGNASTRLTDYFNKCFIHNGFRLSKETHGELAGAFGEIIANAEEHSHKDIAEWYVMGFYNKKSQECKFSIINNGRTIYENLQKSESVTEGVSKIIKDVSSKFGKIYKSKNNYHYEELIWNVMALQDGISSKRMEKGKNSTRGLGLMDVLEFIDVISNPKNDTKIIIISGKSKIIIDYKYPIIEKIVSGEKRRIISFNKEKNLQNPPDIKKVVLLDDSFSGMITTGSFMIDEKFLKTIVRGA